jgi:hypothetical protein
MQRFRALRNAVANGDDLQPHSALPISSDAANAEVENGEVDGASALAIVWEQALQAVGTADAVQIRLTVYGDQHGEDWMLEPGASTTPGATVQRVDLVPHLHRLLTESTGTIANIAHLLETRANEVGDHSRAQLRDDASVLAEELATLNGLLGGPVDWDSEVKRLLAGEIPPFEPDGEQEAGAEEDQ